MARSAIRSIPTRSWRSKQRFDLSITKIEKNDSSTKLEGATFTVRPIHETVHPGDTGFYAGDVLQTVSTDENGETAFNNLSAGYYEVKETVPPAGYIIASTDVFYVRVTQSGIELLKTDPESVPASWTSASQDGIVSAYVNGAATVENTPGHALPNAGGPGSSLFTVLGAVTLSAGAVLAYGWNRRREA